MFTKKLRDDGVNQWTLLTYSFGIGALALLPFQLSQPPLQITDRSAVAAFAGYVLIAAIAGYGAYTAALRYLQASVASILALTEVPFATGFAFIFLGERMNWLQILGALAVVGGVALLATGERSAAPGGGLATEQPRSGRRP